MKDNQRDKVGCGHRNRSGEKTKRDDRQGSDRRKGQKVYRQRQGEKGQREINRERDSGHGKGM